MIKPTAGKNTADRDISRGLGDSFIGTGILVSRDIAAASVLMVRSLALPEHLVGVI